MSALFDVLEDYGWMGVAGLFICMIVFILLRKFGNKLSDSMSSGLEEVGKKLTDHISSQNDKLLETIVTQQDKMVNFFVNKESDKEEKHNNMLSERMYLAEDINTTLKDIMNIHNAQRAFILEFHNSYQNLSGVPFAKYSCNYEWFEKGMTPLCNKCQGLPFSSIAKIVQDILKSSTQQMIYTDMEKLADDNPSLAYMFTENEKQVETCIYTAMYDKNNILIGLLVLEYCNKINIDNINLNQLSIQVAELTSILNIRYKYTK